VSAAADLFAAGRLIACNQVPYMRAGIQSLIPFETEAVPTWTVTDRMVLLWNPTWTLTHSAPAIAGLFAHEYAHVLGKHGERRGLREPKLWNIACDLSINCMLLDAGMKLPEDGMFPDLLDVPHGLEPAEYYELLLKNPPDDSKSGGFGKTSEGCGSGAGNRHAAEDLVPPELAGGRSETEVARINRAVAETIKAFPGRLPGSLKMLANVATEPARVPWEAQLGRAVRGAAGLRAGAVYSTYAAASRRQGGVGYGSGRPVFTAMRAPIPRVSVALDTSGSMYGRELDVACREIGGLLRALSADIDYAACDTRVTVERRIKTIAELRANVVGGGGTDFRPFFDRIARTKKRPDVLIVVTDGYGPAPQKAPGYAVIWLLIGRHAAVPAPWGKVIRVE
jgi:predicted metal-dependent peptidase